MRRTFLSLRHAIDGLRHALVAERNFRGFCALFAVLILLAAFLGFSFPEWVILILLGLCFLIVELLNTAIERITDTIDDQRKKAAGGHYHPGIKMTKDVAAAASLVALIVVEIVLVLLFLPHILHLLNPEAGFLS